MLKNQVIVYLIKVGDAIADASDFCYTQSVQVLLRPWIKPWLAGLPATAAMRMRSQVLCFRRRRSSLACVARFSFFVAGVTGGELFPLGEALFPSGDGLFPSGESPRKNGKRGLVSFSRAIRSFFRGRISSARPWNSFCGEEKAFPVGGMASEGRGNAFSLRPTGPDWARTKRTGGSCWLTAASLVLSGPRGCKGRRPCFFLCPLVPIFSKKGEGILMARVSIPKALDNAAKIKATWLANPTFKLGDITLAGYTALLAKVTEAEAIIETKRHELQGLLDERDDDTRELQAQTTRALSGFRAVYGPDSPQYDQAGGTRNSERAPQKRAPKKTDRA